MYQYFGVMGNYFADRGNITDVDYGRYNVTGKEHDKFMFKVPSLRNVALNRPIFTMARQRLLKMLSIQ